MKLYPLVLTVLLSTAPAVFAQVTLPYTTDFEGPLSSDWATTDTSIVTASDASQSGTKSVRIPSATPENFLSLDFNPSGNSILFADYYMQFTPSALPTLPLLTSPETSALLTVQPYGTGFAKWAFLNGNGAGNGAWETTGTILGLENTGRTSWQHITVRMDLQSNTWDVYIGGVMVAADLGFVEALVSGSEAINLFGAAAGTNYLDNFGLTVDNPLFTDADLDGIEDAFENTNGLDSSVNDRDLDADSDGLTNIFEYAAGLLPNLKDTDGDGLEDGWEVNQGYSANSNQGLTGAFGDLEGDHLANQTETNVGSSSSTVDTTATLVGTSTKTGGNLAITLIGHGTFTIDETATTSLLSN